MTFAASSCLKLRALLPLNQRHPSAASPARHPDYRVLRLYRQLHAALTSSAASAAQIKPAATDCPASWALGTLDALDRWVLNAPPAFCSHKLHDRPLQFRTAQITSFSRSFGCRLGYYRARQFVSIPRDNRHKPLGQNGTELAWRPRRKLLFPPQNSVLAALGFSPARVSPKDARPWSQLLAILEDMNFRP